MKSRLSLFLGFVLLLGVAWAARSGQEGPRVLDASFHHLGNNPAPDWTEASVEPEGSSPVHPRWSSR